MSDRRSHPTSPRWADARPSPYREQIARVAMVAMPVVMIVGGVIGPSVGPAVFGGVWLPLSLWFVIIRPRLQKRRRAYSRPW